MLAEEFEQSCAEFFVQVSVIDGELGAFLDRLVQVLGWEHG